MSEAAAQPQTPAGGSAAATARPEPNLPSHLLAWVKRLGLSQPLRSIRRDFCNGYLIAEILSKYYPADVSIVAFGNYGSLEKKRSNWLLLERLFTKGEIPVKPKLMESVLEAEEGAAVRLLGVLFEYLEGGEGDAGDQDGVQGQVDGQGASQDDAPDGSGQTDAGAMPLPAEPPALSWTIPAQRHRVQLEPEQPEAAAAVAEAAPAEVPLWQSGEMGRASDTASFAAAPGWMAGEVLAGLAAEQNSPAACGQDGAVLPSLDPAFAAIVPGPEPPLLASLEQYQQQQQQQAAVAQPDGFAGGAWGSPEVYWQAAALSSPAALGPGAAEAPFACPFPPPDGTAWQPSTDQYGGIVAYPAYTDVQAQQAYLDGAVFGSMQQGCDIAGSYHGWQAAVPPMVGPPPCGPAFPAYMQQQQLGPFSLQQSAGRSLRVRKAKAAAAGSKVHRGQQEAGSPASSPAHFSPTAAAAGERGAAAPAAAGAAEAPAAADTAAAAGAAGDSSPKAAAARQPPPAPSIEYDKRPRPVDFKPHTHAEYQLRGYDAKQAKGYWELGRLGHNYYEDAEWRQKWEKLELQKQYGRLARAVNQQQAQEQPGSPVTRKKPPSSRERALEFAKKVSKPDSAKHSRAASAQVVEQLSKLQLDKQVSGTDKSSLAALIRTEFGAASRRGP